MSEQTPESQARQEAVGELIHQEVWEMLPEEQKTQLFEDAAAQAEREGIEIANTFVEPPTPNAEPDNKVMFQAFEWYLPDYGTHWQFVAGQAEHWKNLGVGGVWLPPCTKATGTNDVGYGIYDLYDLGEFDQRGSVRTKYGTKQELLDCIQGLHAQGLQVYADVVLNHKAGADASEVFQAVKVNPLNRLEQIADPRDIEGWTRFTFPGRQGQYSAFEWNFNHFTAVDFDQRSGEVGIFKILGDNKDFSPNVDNAFGNYDYLMFADIDYRNKDVMDETLRWAEWFINQTDVDGMRLDAVKHIDSAFLSVFLRETRLRAKKSLYCVGEYWHGDERLLADYIGEAHDQLALFDVALHFNFFAAAQAGRDYDLRTIFNDTLLSQNNFNVVTFVDNQDTQFGQPLNSWVADWFKQLAYALILLRRDGYPCVFWGDYYGISGQDPQPGKREMLDKLLWARQALAYGRQDDYFDDPHVIGWTRLGDGGHNKSGLAVVMSNADAAIKRMCMGDLKRNTQWVDITGRRQDRVTLDDHGWGDFPCDGGSVSVWGQE